MYIGQTIDLKWRIENHEYTLKRNKSNNPYFQKDFNYYGSGNFEVIVLEYCSPNDLDEKEIMWIEKLETFSDRSKGYNLSSGGKISQENEYSKGRNIKRRGGIVLNSAQRRRILLNYLSTLFMKELRDSDKQDFIDYFISFYPFDNQNKKTIQIGKINKIISEFNIPMKVVSSHRYDKEKESNYTFWKVVDNE